MIDEVIESWWINHRVTLLLLEGVSEAGMLCTLSTRGGRSVGRQFGHLQYNRVAQLKKRARAVAGGVLEIDTKIEPKRAQLVRALDDSAERVAEWFERAAAGEKGFLTMKRGVVSTLGYMIAHESHHRGSILLTLKQCGEPIPKDIRDGIWNWNKV